MENERAQKGLLILKAQADGFRYVAESLREIAKGMPLNFCSGGNVCFHVFRIANVTILLRISGTINFV